MAEFELSKHAKDMLLRRRILEEWIWRAIDSPTKKWRGNDGNLHYINTIHERENRVLHVVVNTNTQPNRIVTVFLDRRLGKKQ